MLADLPFELVDAIAQFLGYRDLVSLKLTCKNLKEHVEFVKVRHLNVFIDALPYEGKLFHSNEPISYAESLTACPERILSPAFVDQFRHLKRLTFQQKTYPYCEFALEDLNVFKQLEHLELRAYCVNEGGCLKLNKLRVLLIETISPVPYVVDCEQLIAIHFRDLPQIVHTNNLRHVSFIEMTPEQFEEFCIKCPNLTRLTLASHTFDSSISYGLETFTSSTCLLYEILYMMFGRNPEQPFGLICENRLRCLKEIELDTSCYVLHKLISLRKILRGLMPPSLRWEEVGSPGKEVFERLKFYVGSQDLVNDENFDELHRVVNDQFEEFENPNGRKLLNLMKLTYSNLAKFQRLMEGLIPSLRHISIDKKLNLTREQLLYRLANLRQLLIKGNRLDETILNQFTRQFRYLELLGFAECAIQTGNLALLRNHSVHVLMFENCTCSDLNFLKSFENVRYLCLYKLEQEKRFRSILEFRESFSSILKSLRCIMTFGHETLGTFENGNQIVLSSKIASTIEEMMDFYNYQNFLDQDLLSDCFVFQNLDEFIDYACRIHE